MSISRLALTLAALLCTQSLQAQRQPAASKAVPAAQTMTAAQLITLMDQVVQALLANDASRLPLAEGFRYTENGQQLDIGDGLWRTLSAYAGQDPRIAPASASLKYRLNVVDAANGEIVAYRAIDESGTGGILIIRLKAVGGKINELEAIPVRHEYSGPRGGTVTLLQARMMQMFNPALLGAVDPIFATAAPTNRASLIAATNAYFDGQEASRSAGISFDVACARRDNGHQVTGVASSPPLDAKKPAYKPWALGCSAQVDSGLYRYIEQVRDRRFVVDASRGVVVAIDLMDVPGTVHSIDVPAVGKVSYPGAEAGASSINVGQQFNDFGGANLKVPSTMLAVHLFKVRAGKIVRIETFYRPAPYGLRSGW
jgi:hypothetical protein